MLITVDLMENRVLGPMILERDRGSGLRGEWKIVRQLVEKRFGMLPEWADQKLGAFSTGDMEALTDRLLDATTLEDLLK